MASSNVPARQHDMGDEQKTEIAVVLPEHLLQQFAEMAVMIPTEGGGGTEDILTRLLNAKTWAELNEPWETTDVDDLRGKPMRLMSAVRRPSDFKNGLGQFLIVKLVDPKTGKEVVKTTGSISCVGAIAWLYANSALPAMIEWCKAERPTDDGYFPQHLKILDAVTRPTVQASATRKTTVQ